jgi:hypothetical protein
LITVDSRIGSGFGQPHPGLWATISSHASDNATHKAIFGSAFHHQICHLIEPHELARAACAAHPGQVTAG